MLKLTRDIRSANLTVLVHATEDSDKIASTISNTLGLDKDRFVRNQSRGHYDNPIILLELEIIDEDSMESVLKIFDNIVPLEKEKLESCIEEYIDDQGILYIRFDKQSFFRSHLVLSQKDSVRIKFRPRPRKSLSRIFSKYKELSK